MTSSIIHSIPISKGNGWVGKRVLITGGVRMVYRQPGSSMCTLCVLVLTIYSGVMSQKLSYI